MTFEILVATMYQKDYSLLDKMRVASNAVVINQCDENSRVEFNYHGYKILWINSTERGLSRSRNMALKNAHCDICLICDDDEILNDKYAEHVINAYKTISDASCVVFNVENSRASKSKIIKISKSSWYKNYSSQQISFLRKDVINRKIIFNNIFGTGSGMFSHGEDTLFCIKCKKEGLRMYTYPYTVASLVERKSSWFVGYDEKYLYDTGAFLSEAYPLLKWIFMFWYPYRFRKLSKLSIIEMLHLLYQGFKGYKEKINYENFVKKYGVESREEE